MSSTQALALPLVALSFLALATGESVAQTSLDDIHVNPRDKTVDIATTDYGPGGRFGSASLIRTSVNLVLVPVSITDDRNRPILGLDEDNFELFEGKEPQTITHFSSEDTPISVGILVDTSGSMSYKLDRAREAVKQFCEAANPQDEFFMITFANRPQLATGFTASTDEIENELLTLRSKGETSLLDAIYMALREMRSARYGRRALLILSDGGDNHSRYTEHDVKSAIKEADVMIYAVGTYDRYVSTEEEMLGPELLESIADMTGGRSFALDNINDMPGVTRAIGIQLRHQYMLAYQPATKPHDGRWHKISVRLRLPKKLRSYFMRVDARAGYYATGG
ncbi:MAG TPA: VWA domain-containing protein [Verrucomicrobiae bacterium]|nr:VWA domain-containing protein [Verrucomicrobiae bacterium]